VVTVFLLEWICCATPCSLHHPASLALFLKLTKSLSKFCVEEVEQHLRQCNYMWRFLTQWVKQGNTVPHGQWLLCLSIKSSQFRWQQPASHRSRGLAHRAGSLALHSKKEVTWDKVSSIWQWSRVFSSNGTLFIPKWVDEWIIYFCQWIYKLLT
jgi:hypothetical protein